MLFLVPLLALAPGQAAIARHPAGAQLVLTIPDLAAASEAYRRTALLRALADEELHAALGRMLGRESLDPLAYLSEAYDAAVADGRIPELRETLWAPLQSLSLSLTVDGGLAALFQAGSVAQDGNERARILFERLSVQLDLTYGAAEEAAAALSLVEGSLRSLGPEAVARRSVEQQRLELVTYVPTKLPLRASAVQDQARLTFFLGRDEDALLGRLTSGQGALDASALDKALPPADGVTVLTLHNVLTSDLWALPDAEPALLVVDVLEGLFGSLAGMLLRAGDWRVAIDEDGQFHTEGRCQRPTSPFERILGGAPIQRSALSLVHPEAIVARVSHFDKEALIEGLNLLAQRADRDFMGEIEAVTGVRPDRDLIAHLGPALAYSLPAPTSLLSAPPFTLACALIDRAAFERSLIGLLEFAAGASEGHVTLTNVEYRGARLLTLQLHPPEGLVLFSIPIDLSVIFRPTLVVMDERIFATTQPTHAKAEIRRMAKEEIELHALLPAELREGTTSYGFADWTKFLAQLYGGARAFAGLAGALSNEELPVDLKALPDATIITRHFRPTVRWRTLAAGLALEHERSSTGPELLLVPLAAALFGASAAHGDDPPPPTADQTDAGGEGD